MTVDGKAYDAWMLAGMGMWMLAAETSVVMVLRMVRIPTGGTVGAAEVDVMVEPIPAEDETTPLCDPPDRTGLARL